MNGYSLCCYRCDIPMTEDDHAQVQATLDEYLDAASPEQGERFVDRMLRAAAHLRADQKLGDDPVVCHDCLRHLTHVNSKGSR